MANKQNETGNNERTLENSKKRAASEKSSRLAWKFNYESHVVLATRWEFNGKRKCSDSGHTSTSISDIHEPMDVSEISVKSSRDVICLITFKLHRLGFANKETRTLSITSKKTVINIIVGCSPRQV